MQAFLQQFVDFVNNLNEIIGRATSWLLAVLVVLVCFDVIARKLFNFSKIWMMEMEWHLYSLIFLLAAGYALKHDRHVRVDLFYEKYGKRDKALTNFWGHLIFLIPWCIMVILSTYHYAMESFSINEGSPEPGGLPARYIIKFAITFGAFLLMLQAIAGLIESGFILFDKRDDLNSDDSKNKIPTTNI